MSTVPHPSKFSDTITSECNLCGGHFGDGTPYLKLELETWSGADAVLCGKCVDAMHAHLHPTSGEDDETARLFALAKEHGVKNAHTMKPETLRKKLAEAGVSV